MAYHGIKVMVFDLGGVLVDWIGTRPLFELAGGSFTEEHARRYWLTSPWVKRFETGRCTPDQFAAEVVSELGLPVSPKKFLVEFISWDRGLLPGAGDLLDALRSRFVLVCLSNNNELHWKPLWEDAGLDKKFHHLYISFQTGLSKPETEAFEQVINGLGYLPGEYLFFDDNVECVHTARSLGMKAYRVSGVEDVKKVLQSLDIEV
jgi:putative hydrolase of the HAD superfamily